MAQLSVPATGVSDKRPLQPVSISLGPWAQRILSAILGLIFYVWPPLLILAMTDSAWLFWLSLAACAWAWVYVREWQKTHY